MPATTTRACPLCEAICGLEIEVVDRQVAAIRGDRQDVFSRGHVCPKAVALQDLETDPERLRRPLRRVGETWQEIGWDEAFDEAAKRLGQVQAQHGRDAVAVYLGNPNVHNYGSTLYLPPLLKALGSKNLYSATSVDQLPHHLAAQWMFGHGLLLPVPDLDHTQFLLVLGANPAVSNGSLMTAPGVKERLKAIRARGGTIVLVDPRRTETAALADRHLAIRPGADAFLLAALLATLFEEDLARPGRLAALTNGLAEARAAFAAFPPEAVEGATGIPAAEIRRLARELAAAPSAAVYSRLGTSLHPFGTTCQWLVNLLNVVTGNLDRPGGALFTRPAVEVVRGGRGKRRFDRWRSRVRGLPEYGGELPSATLADELLTPGPGQVKALVVVAGNPVLSTPNGARLEAALPGLDFVLAIDFYRTETTRHAHLILPPTPPLQHDHYDVVFNALAVRNVARYSAAVFPPEPGTRHDWQILHALRCRLERGGGLRARFERWLAGRGPARLLDVALRTGPYGAGFVPWKKGLTLARLRRHPHGLDLGPLAASLPGRLRTASGKIELAPEALVADLGRLREALAATSAQNGGIVLIGRRQVRSNNSWMHQVPRLTRGKDPCTLLLNPADAKRLGLGDGDQARITSRTGSVTAPVEITDNLRPGVASLPHGWGHTRPGFTRPAVNHAGASFNDLSDELLLDPVSGNAVLNGVPVEIASTSS